MRAADVAPLVGAWIEMNPSVKSHDIKNAVAPLVGAWIEMNSFLWKRQNHPVAPLVGAWIEIFFDVFALGMPIMSLPLWERGLKLHRRARRIRLTVSLPLWERGLKCVLCSF